MSVRHVNTGRSASCESSASAVMMEMVGCGIVVARVPVGRSVAMSGAHARHRRRAKKTRRPKSANLELAVFSHGTELFTEDSMFKVTERRRTSRRHHPYRVAALFASFGAISAVQVSPGPGCVHGPIVSRPGSCAQEGFPLGLH